MSKRLYDDDDDHYDQYDDDDDDYDIGDTSHGSYTYIVEPNDDSDQEGQEYYTEDEDEDEDDENDDDQQHKQKDQDTNSPDKKKRRLDNRPDPPELDVDQPTQDNDTSFHFDPTSSLMFSLPKNDQQQQDNQKKHKEKQKQKHQDQDQSFPPVIDQLLQLVAPNIQTFNLENPLDTKFLNTRKNAMLTNKVYLGNLSLATKFYIPDITNIQPEQIVSYLKASYDLRMPVNAFNLFSLLLKKSKPGKDIFTLLNETNIDWDLFSTKLSLTHEDLVVLHESSKEWYTLLVSKLLTQGTVSLPFFLAQFPKHLQDSIQDYILYSSSQQNENENENEKKQTQIDF